MAQTVRSGSYDELPDTLAEDAFIVTGPPDKRGLYIGETTEPWNADIAAINALPALLGLVAWTFDPGSASDGNVDTSGKVHGAALWLPAGKTITKLSMFCTVAAVAPTHFQMGVYDRAGNLIAQTADTPATLLGTGWLELALTAPWTVPASGLYYFADLLAAGTTMPTMLVANPVVNGGRSSLPPLTFVRLFATSAAFSALPANINVQDQALASARSGVILAR